MSWSFVVISESAAVVANRDSCLFELNEALGRNRRAFRRNFRLSKKGVERILCEYVLDVRNEQFLLLLFMMNSENNIWLKLLHYVFVYVGNELSCSSGVLRWVLL